MQHNKKKNTNKRLNTYHYVGNPNPKKLLQNPHKIDGKKRREKMG